jgi:hypothetical protein
MVEIACRADRYAIFQKKIERAGGETMPNRGGVPLAIGHTNRNPRNLPKQRLWVRGSVLLNRFAANDSYR